jgi:hypothetical protein
MIVSYFDSSYELNLTNNFENAYRKKITAKSKKSNKFIKVI